KSASSFIIVRTQPRALYVNSFKGSRTQPCQPYADIPSHASKIGHDHLRFARKARPHFFILGGNPCWAGVQVALPGHNAAHGQQGSSSEAKLVSAQQSGNDYITSEFESAIDAQPHSPAKARPDQRAVGLAQADILDRSQR